MYKVFYQIKVVTNPNLQLLCYVIFFDILHHYGVIAASQICSVSTKYCAVLRNRFFDIGSHCSFISPDVVQRLNLRVIKQVPVNLSTFGNDTESCMLDLVRVKVRFGKSKVPLTMLVHDSAAMGYFHSPGLFELAQKLKQKGFQSSRLKHHE